MRNIAAKYDNDNIYYIFMCGLLAAKYYAINIIQQMPLLFPNGNIIFQ